MIKLSVIIPYYKSLTNTLTLLELLRKQCTEETEVIVVDDGCNELSLDSQPFTVIHLAENSGGASVPRNVGIELSQGEYIAFIDSDDLVSNNYISTILEKIRTESFDYCYISWSGNGTVIIKDQPPTWNCCVWNCVYKRSLIGNERFDPKLKMAEDNDFNRRVKKGKRANITEVLYYYNETVANSLSKVRQITNSNYVEEPEKKMIEIDVFGNRVTVNRPNNDPTEPIDIVIPWVNTSSEKWQKLYSHYKNLESGVATDSNNAFGEATFRDWGTLKWWFRGVEVCCPWVRKVFLILQDESHIPDWLNTNYCKLQIVYHKDYIPEGLLPTFNSMTILSFVPLIEDLSTNYIVCNDDTYFINYISKSRFFTQDNLPVLPLSYFTGESYANAVGCEWGYNLDNTYELTKKYGDPDTKYGITHLQMPHNKPFDLQILKENWQEIYDSFLMSHFRNKQNINDSTVFTDSAKRLGKCLINNRMYRNCCFVTLKDTVNFRGLTQQDMICFNDYQYLDFNKVKNNLTLFLNNKFPKKSGFEV